MPLLRYFLFVGGALLTLLFAISAYAPPPAAKVAQSDPDLSIIRIHSDQKWPERVVFDTSRPTMAAPANVVTAAIAAPAPPVAPGQKSAAVQPLKKGVREAFAQVQTGPVQHHRAEAKRRSFARNNPYPATIVVAQQPHFGLFGNMW